MVSNGLCFDGTASHMAQHGRTVFARLQSLPLADRRWFHWRISSSHCFDRVVLTNAGELLFAEPTPRMTAVARLPAGEWRNLDGRAIDQDGLAFTLDKETTEVEIAHSIPYSAPAAATTAWQWIFDRPEQAELPRISVLRGAAGRPETTHWVVCRQHPVETLASHFAQALQARIHADSPVPPWTWAVVPVANPEGCRLGTSRLNGQGIDMNRCWGVPGQPREVGHLLDGMRELGCHFFLDVHADEKCAQPYLHLGAVNAAPASPAAQRERAFKLALERALGGAPLATYDEAPGGLTRGLGAYHVHQTHGCPAIVLEIPMQRDVMAEPLASDTLARIGELADGVYRAICVTGGTHR